jgi:hypothetical protein
MMTIELLGGLAIFLYGMLADGRGAEGRRRRADEERSSPS